MPFDPITAIALAESALRVGMEGYEMAKRLTADGYPVPTLAEFEAKTAAFRALPDLTPTTEKEGD